MVLRMQYSGYNKMFRYEMVDSAVKAYRARQEPELKGERPMHRLKGWKEDERVMEKSGKRDTREEREVQERWRRSGYIRACDTWITATEEIPE